MSRFDGVETWQVEQPDGSLLAIPTSGAGRDHLLIEAALSPAARAPADPAAETRPEADSEAEAEGEA
jgi:hypothetical protein